jgi:toluene monooxygenase system ferredoxin subunit
MPLKCIGSVEGIDDPGMKAFNIDGACVLVLRSDGEYFAYQGDCPHEKTPLEDGLFDGETLTCILHLWQWDVRTGTPKGAAEAGLTAYPVEVRDKLLYVQV